MNAYAVSLSKYVNTGILAAFTLLAFLSFAARSKALRRVIEVFQCLLLTAFLANANLTIAWLVKGAAGRRLCLLCAMEILFLLSFMVLYRIVHEMADMFLFNNLCMLLSIGFVTISRIAYYGPAEKIALKANEPIKQFVIASGGLLIMLLIPFFRRFFDAMRNLGLVFGIMGIIALGGVLFLSVATNGAMITYTIAGFTFQPSEFVKILFLLMLAGMLSGEVSLEKGIFVTILSMAHIGILVLSRDLGSALVFFFVFLMMMFLATGKWSVIFGGIAFGAMGSVICYYLFSHVRVRVLIWQNPLAESLIDDLGYQLAQALFAIGYGGLWGAGLTQGAPDQIPVVESDFIFAAIAEEMGLVFGVCLLLLCINCFLRVLSLSASYSNRFFQLFTYGAAVCYIFQTFLTVGGETKFIPLTGVTLPLVSYGGSSILSTLIMFGMIEMIFILHDERTSRFLARYEMEHAGEGVYGDPDQTVIYNNYGNYDGQGNTGSPDSYGNNGGQDYFGSNDSYNNYNGYGNDGSKNGYNGGYHGYNGYSGNGDHGRNTPIDPGPYGENLPENYPVNGISEEGIFDD